MARKPDEWMPLNIGKYLGDTLHLTREQHGGYLLLLMAYWRRGGPLLADDAQLAGITKASRAEWKKLRPVLSQFFREEDGKWHQKKADEELNKAMLLVSAKASAGAAGGRAKWGEDGGQPHQRTRSERLAAARAKATHTAEEWEMLVSIFQGRCVRCGDDSERPVKDHIKPIYKGGDDGIDNLQPLCRTCNCSKGPEEVDHRKNALQDWRERLAKCLAHARQMAAPLPSPLPSEVETSLRSVSPQADTPKPKVKSRRSVSKTEPLGFPAFYEAYPLKKERPRAADAFDAALTRTGAAPEVLLAGAQRYATERRDEDPRYTKHPATWLNNDCWLDEAQAPAAAQPRRHAPGFEPSKIFTLKDLEAR